MYLEMNRLIANTLISLDFVKWDRFVQTSTTEIQVYGWIEREKDTYKDFISIDFTYIFPDQLEYSFLTSSAKYTDKIFEILGGDNHSHCQRVEDSFNVKNSIKLATGKYEIEK